MKRAFIKLLTVVLLIVSLTPISVSAKSYKCIASGCKNTCSGKSVYCYKHECSKSGCTSKGIYNGYCSTHKAKTTTSTTNKKKSYNTSKSSSKSKSYKKTYDSYDSGYEDVWLNDDYDWDRYCNDWDYALGVDDAMDEFGYDW